MKILVIGAGLAGSSFARLIADNNDVYVFEKNNFIGGNCFDQLDDNGILIHLFGPHIFHTSNRDVWNFVNQFSRFKKVTHQALVSVDDYLLQMPINLNSIKTVFPDLFTGFLEEVHSLKLFGKQASILQLLNCFRNNNNKKIVNFFYEKVFANYTSKMWGIPIDKLGKNIIERVKINLSYNWDYFPEDEFCGLPVEGYTQLITNMLDHPNIKVFTNKNIIDFKVKDNLIYIDNKFYDLVIFTGSIDELFSYKYGVLPYRSLNIKFETIYNDYLQTASIVNYPQDPYLTRICEYKILNNQRIDGVTTISKEYPGEFYLLDPVFYNRFYPIRNFENDQMYNKYLEETKKINNLYLLGRLAEYKYYDMDDVISSAMKLIEKLNLNN